MIKTSLIEWHYLNSYNFIIKQYKKIVKKIVAHSVFVFEKLGFQAIIFRLFSRSRYYPFLANFIVNEESCEILVRFARDANQKAEVFWILSRFDSFLEACKTNQDLLSPINRIRFFYLLKDFDSSDYFLKKESFGRHINEACKLHLLLLLSFHPELFDQEIKVIRKIANNNDLEKIKEYYYKGDVRGAEIYRMSRNESCHNQLVKLGCYSSNILLSHNYIFKGCKILFVPEQGIADEVRWSRLYKFLDFDNITFACDERLEFFLQRFLSNAAVLPFKSLYSNRSDVELTISAIESSRFIGSVFNEFDFVFTNCAIFSLLNDEELKTEMLPWLNDGSEFNLDGSDSRKKRVGIAWESATRNPMRSARYGLPLSDIAQVVKEYSNKVDFYSLQAKVTSKEKHICEEIGVKEIRGVDLYNDFVASADFYTELDAVVGVSTLNTELAASVGPTFYHVAMSPDILYMRSGALHEDSDKISLSCDQLGNNTVTVFPLSGYGVSRSEVAQSCFRCALDKILS
ncbi:hypothetical protein [Marinospirillum sp.]|uniref:hypothetical protein n=1 Tax=Marinospirillum sp. TaxID=2183934 RepID=UPI0038500ACE